jgi:murein DD-endopeptidase MepM/ murein hydrolase activator NlpD
MYWKLLLSVLAICLITVLAPTAAQPNPKPFSLPVAAPPGPSTWLFGQPYGNTVGAFARAAEWYAAGQGLHFGIDISMPCGTPLIAMADGVVDYVDDLGFGSAPHNLLIRHDQAGVIVLYGHLLERPSVVPGQQVTQGEVVAHSGDPDITCDSRPHLHLEVRGPTYRTAHNPISYIDANWHVLTGIGSFSSRSFMQNLDNARQWMSLDDQPDVAFGGAMLNNYAAPYPDTRESSPPANPPLPRQTAPLSTESWSLRRLAFDGCCAGAWWNPTQANHLYVIDGSPGQRASVFEWDTDAGTLVNLVGQAPPPHLSADGTHSIERRDDQFAIRRLADNTEWLVNTDGAFPSLNVDNTQLMWTLASEIPLPNEDQPLVEVWTAEADGSNARVFLSESGISAQWLDSTRLLVIEREESITTIRVYDTANGIPFTLGSWEFLRSLSVAPGGSRLIFYTVYDPDPSVNGIYTIETQPEAQAQHLPWFGGWRWRDADSLFYLPLDASSPVQTLHYYDILTGEDRALTDPTSTAFTVANGDWSVSPDGSQVAFRNAQDMTLWLLEAPSSTS